MHSLYCYEGLNIFKYLFILFFSDVEMLANGTRNYFSVVCFYNEGDNIKKGIGCQIRI